MKDFINKHKFLKWIIWFLGVLVIGGLGSGFWEMLLKPILSYTSNVVINYLVSISVNLSDDIYKSISFRNLYSVQIQIYNLMVLIFGILAIFMFGVIPKLIKFIKDNYLNFGTCIAKNEEVQKLEFKEYKIIRLHMIMIFLMTFLVFIVGAFDVMKSQYISKKVFEFEYMLKVNSDVLNDDQLKQIESKFAQIRNSEDYEKIIKSLQEIALKNNKKLNRNPL